MNSTQETYKEVAQCCSSYSRCECDNCFSNVLPDVPSCLNCTHFDSDEHCTLDLYDAIVDNL